GRGQWFESTIAHHPKKTLRFAVLCGLLAFLWFVLPIVASSPKSSPLLRVRSCKVVFLGYSTDKSTDNLLLP
ncbi:MAG: hypothetical protein IJC66_10005, partial [Kiritimatiellae bacterium]|nr:hypothetical protein [Kiritimatiellia bacterium]